MGKNRAKQVAAREQGFYRLSAPLTSRAAFALTAPRWRFAGSLLAAVAHEVPIDKLAERPLPNASSADREPFSGLKSLDLAGPNRTGGTIPRSRVV